MKNKNIIFNIQKFSIHDGPGIRTVIFFKGCPLRCYWCSNPESQIQKKQILWQKKLCCHCKNCIDTCQENAVYIKDNDIYIDSKKCNGCDRCVQECNVKALSSEGKQYLIDDVINICMQDIDFYLESGGGVTVSGGEAMLYPEFVIELFTHLKSKGINTAIETSGYIASNVYNKVIPFADLLLFDVKHYDRKKHFEGTGVFNDLIIENLKYSIKINKTILLRIPVIPEYNNSLEDAYNFCDLLLNLNIKKVQLLPFHQYGEMKYEMLHIKYKLKAKPQLYLEDLIPYQKVFTDKGLECFI